MLDLDETLVHGEQYDSSKSYDTMFEIDFGDCPNSIERIGLYVRPYTLKFLEAMSERFEIVVFTAA